MQEEISEDSARGKRPVSVTYDGVETHSVPLLGDIRDEAIDWSPLLKFDLTPRKYEVAFGIFALIVTYLVWDTPLPFSRALALHFFERVFGFVGVVYMVAVVVTLIKGCVRWTQTAINPFTNKRDLIEVIQPYWTLNYLLLTFRRGVAILGVVYFFLHLKHVVLFINRENYDLFFWNLDRTLHFGVQPNVWAMETFGNSVDLGITIDWIYSWMYFKYLIAAAIMFLFEVRGRDLTEKFFLAYTLLWAFGGLGYLIMPADGPVYAILGDRSVAKESQRHIFQFPITEDVPLTYKDTYSEAKIWKAKLFQEKLWEHRRRFLERERLPGRFYGIAAMPSLHIAAVTMLMIFFFFISPYLGVVGAIWVGVMFFGSIFLQWHYAVDGYAGMLLAAVVCFFSLRYGGYRWRKEQTPEETPG